MQSHCSSLFSVAHGTSVQRGAKLCLTSSYILIAWTVLVITFAVSVCTFVQYKHTYCINGDIKCGVDCQHTIKTVS